MQTTSIHPLLAQKKDKDFISILVILAALWGVLWVTGCAKKTDTGMTDSTSTTTATTSTPATTATTTGTTASMSDANIIAALSEGDSAEITEAKLAMAKSKNPQVKAFAQMMITDHTKMKNDKANLAKQLNITPQPPANDQTPSQMTSELSALNSASSSRAFDSIYVNDAVVDHQKDLSEATQMQSQASAPQLKTAIGQALPVIQKHLDHAQMMQKKMEGSSMAMGKQAR
ncbi:MAG TPA: DUF4142 domain-containing protein [Candidatus Kapabacteria bacterium]|jgi:putative membrane protein